MCYLTLLSTTRAEIKERGSRFICRVDPVASEQEAETCISEVRREHHKATHNCYAYSIGTGDRALQRSSDDGEPAGTAGKPMLGVLQNGRITQVAAVVSRYFGGTKLGTGGLIRAYSGAVRAALEGARFREIEICDTIEIECRYPDLPIVEKALNRHNADVLESHYESRVRICVRIQRDRVSHFKRDLIDPSSGRIVLRP